VLTTAAAVQPEATHAAPGRGAIAVARRDGRSVVTRAYATSPLRLLTPANHGNGAWVYTSSFGGGLVDGDQIHLDVHVGPGATAYLSTQSSTKVYRSPTGTTATIHAVVAAGGLLVVAPDPVVPFAGARYRQVQRFDIGGDAGLVVVDSLHCGRRASGERWCFADYESTVEMSVEGRLRVYDVVALRRSDGNLASRMGRFNVLAMALVAGRALQTETADVLAQASAHPAARRLEQVISASSLGDDACLVRIAGTSAERAGRTLRELLRFVPARLADNPWARKW
jgi:urease accessory protein